MCTMLVFTVALSLVLSGQACPNDWVQFENSCYVFINEYVSWTSAKVFCDTLGAKMLEVNSQAENDFITSEISKLSGFQGVWLGLTDLVREGRWVWNSNREEPEFTNWRPGEPSDDHRHENGEDCVQLMPGGKWNDLWCEDAVALGYKNSPVCELDQHSAEIIG